MLRGGPADNEDEEDESGEEDGDDEDHVSAKLDTAMYCDRDYL